MSDKPNNPICAITWRDAAFSFEEEIFPIPKNKVTVGFIIEAGDDYVNIATTTDYDSETGKIYPKDGYLIPKKAIIDFIKIGDFNKHE